MNKEINNKIALCPVLDPVAVTATTTTDLVDTKGFESLSFIVNVGAGTFDADNKLVFKLQHADVTTGTSFEDVTASTDQVGSFSAVDGTNADENSVQKVAYIGTKRYVRLVATETGTVSTVLAVNGLLSHARKDVASNVAATAAT